jgi:hexosaminidase
VIDLGKPHTIKQVIIHSFTQEASWIWPPLLTETKVFISSDSINFSNIDGYVKKDITTNAKYFIITQSFDPKTTRFVKVYIKNYGPIPQGNPGAGNKAWLFVDEIEVN